MNTHEIVNLIVQKFGGNRVKFEWIDEEKIVFCLGHNQYRLHWSEIFSQLMVSRMAYTDLDGCLVRDNYSKWVEGILNGMVRNEAGEMVAR
jgi:hypothetical protein